MADADVEGTFAGRALEVTLPADDETPRRILVTGARGFLGRRVVEQLLARGHGVAGLEGGPEDGRTAALRARYSDRFRVLRTDGAPAQPEIERWAPDTLVHLASYVPTSQLEADPCKAAAAARDGVLGATLAILDAVRASVRQVIFASSVTVYGNAPGLLDEAAPCAPTAPYSIFKLAAEQTLTWLCARLACEATILRICQLYGPGEPHGLFLQRVFIPRAQRGEPLTLVHGGREQKTLLWVDDAARAVAQAVARRAAGTFNVAPERSESVLGLARMVVEASGGRSEIVVTDEGAPVATHGYAVERARAALGFAAQTGLREGIQLLCT